MNQQNETAVETPTETTPDPRSAEAKEQGVPVLGLNRHQVKKQLNCGDSMFWKLVRTGELEGAFYVGRDVRIPPGSVLDYVRRRQEMARADRST